MTNKLKGCKYCKEIIDFDEDYLRSHGGLYIHTIENPSMFVTAEDAYSFANFTINFCPCCGRRLREDLIEDIDTLY